MQQDNAQRNVRCPSMTRSDINMLLQIPCNSIRYRAVRNVQVLVRFVPTKAWLGVRTAARFDVNNQNKFRGHSSSFKFGGEGRSTIGTIAFAVDLEVQKRRMLYGSIAVKRSWIGIQSD